MSLRGSAVFCGSTPSPAGQSPRYGVGGSAIPVFQGRTRRGRTRFLGPSQWEPGRATGRILGQPRLISTPENNTISGNQAEFGGGIVVENSSPTISGNTISGNQAAVKGGGIMIRDNSSSIISGNTISGNRAVTGGGIRVQENSSPTISGNTISDNQAETGGGIWVSGDSTLILNEPDDNIYSDNQPDDIYHSPD